jgi:hypothetical protein
VMPWSTPNYSIPAITLRYVVAATAHRNAKLQTTTTMSIYYICIICYQATTINLDQAHSACIPIVLVQNVCCLISLILFGSRLATIYLSEIDIAWIPPAADFIIWLGYWTM